MKFNKEYTPVIILFLFILGMLSNCLELVRGTGDIIYFLLILIPTPVFILMIIVAVFKIRKEKSI
ncbi:MAG: hypothetical protein ACTSVY_03960 [Candidatus Helarchaeota archaeon]